MIRKRKASGNFGFLWGYQGREELKDYFQCENEADERSHAINYYVDLAIFFNLENLVLDEINEAIENNAWEEKEMSEHTIGLIHKLDLGL